ncbi:hypothetical protein HJA88_13560 [Rhizobium bangladeshense]|nr:hypothetical protein [Rhizobium bangladeshense]
MRLFDLIKGPYWTLLAYEVKQAAVPPRPGLHIHTIGRSSDVIAEGGYFRGPMSKRLATGALPSGRLCPHHRHLGEASALEADLVTVGL